MLALGLCLVPAPPHWCDRRKWQQRGDWKNSKAEPRPPQFGTLSGEFGGPDCALIGRRSRRWAGRPRHPTRRCSLPTCAESGRGLTTAKQPRQLLLWLAPLPPPNPRLRACLPPAGSCVGVSNPKRRTRPPGRSWGDGQGRSGPAGDRGLSRLASPRLSSPHLSGALRPPLLAVRLRGVHGRRGGSEPSRLCPQDLRPVSPKSGEPRSPPAALLPRKPREWGGGRRLSAHYPRA